MAKFPIEKIVKDETISFRYKGGRKVKGQVFSVEEKTCVIRLETDYIGKNQEWYSGELKRFNIAEMLAQREKSTKP